MPSYKSEPHTLGESFFFFFFHTFPNLIWTKLPRATLSLSGRVVLSIARRPQEPEVRVRYPVRLHTFVSSSTDPRRAVDSYWRTYVHEVLVNRLCPGLADRPDMTLAVYRGRKTTTQQQQRLSLSLSLSGGFRKENDALLSALAGSTGLDL